MRSAALIAAVFAATALGGPIKPKRAYVTELTTVVVTQYVYVDAPAATAVVEKEPETPEDHHVEVPAEKTPVAESDWSTAAPVEEPSAAPAPARGPPAPVPSPQAPEPSYVKPDPSPEAPAPVPEPASEAPAPTYAESEPAPSAVATPVDDYQRDILHHHNIHRANHTVDDLTWSDDLAAAAHMLAESCDFDHKTFLGVGGYGQNLAASGPDRNVTSSITNGWYNGEIGFYEPFYGREPEKSNFHAWGHFSQMVWKDTKQVGCATFDCRNTQKKNGDDGAKNIIHMWYTVCNYSPPGNYEGSYAANVLSPRGDATAQWNS